MMKLLLVLIIVVILMALGSALLSLLRHQGPNEKVVKALTLRIGLSVGLFLLLMLGHALNWWQPHGIS